MPDYVYNHDNGDADKFTSNYPAKVTVDALAVEFGNAGEAAGEGDTVNVELRSAADDSTIAAFDDYTVNEGDAGNGFFIAGPVDTGDPGAPARYWWVHDATAAWELRSLEFTVGAGGGGAGGGLAIGGASVSLAGMFTIGSGLAVAFGSGD